MSSMSPPYHYYKANILQLCLWCYCSSSLDYIPDLWYHIIWPWSYASSLSRKKNKNKIKYQSLSICHIQVHCQDRWWWTLFYFLFSFFILLFFSFSFNFLFLEQLGLGVISHAVTSVTNWWRSHKTDHETWEKEVEGSGTKWRHTAWTTHTGLMLYSW